MSTSRRMNDKARDAMAQARHAARRSLRMAFAELNRVGGTADAAYKHSLEANKALLVMHCISPKFPLNAGE